MIFSLIHKNKINKYFFYKKLYENLILSIKKFSIKD